MSTVRHSRDRRKARGRPKVESCVFLLASLAERGRVCKSTCVGEMCVGWGERNQEPTQSSLWQHAAASFLGTPGSQLLRGVHFQAASSWIPGSHEQPLNRKWGRNGSPGSLAMWIQRYIALSNYDIGHHNYWRTDHKTSPCLLVPKCSISVVFLCESVDRKIIFSKQIMKKETKEEQEQQSN